MKEQSSRRVAVVTTSRADYSHLYWVLRDLRDHPDLELKLIADVGLVGFPNVGKSTIFNRFLGRRMAIVDDAPGVTRDRNFARAEWAELGEGPPPDLTARVPQLENARAGVAAAEPSR